MANITVNGLYKIKDKYFKEFGNGYWVDNKQENRPYFFLIKDSDGIDWMIPLSSQVENYRQKIEKVEAKQGEGNCIYYHIGVIASKERVFLIGDMFPVDSSYIKAPYMIKSMHYVSKNRKLNNTLLKKSKRFLKLVQDGKIKSRNDILGIKQILLSRKGS